ncbi:alpha/beta hydrolase [Nonomuraea spiralis]|uniref:Alpha/beta hydrolase n=1 Tax=Nonomuraea spiralis TaxID=46182 RepID=A0ABV5IX05_9ACTN|nr:alpha/beta hydrolase [Nonomuraea spiralis]GGS90126.1 esterase [Nonomuraea spiralis]
MNETTTARPGLDPELRALLADLPLTSGLDAEALARLRRLPSTPVDAILRGHAADHREISAPVPLSIFTPARADQAPAPCVYWVHGGGMVMGDRFSQIDIPLDWLDLFGATVVSVEYRLAPEATGTTPVEDCYRGLLWVAEHAGELGVDPGRIIVAGASAGGGLAAGLTLLARDRGAPSIAAQVLVCPMLDHRDNTTSSHQYAGDPGVWTREMNEFGWRSLIGRGEVSGYMSPAIADDLSGLPTTYVDAGTAEVFRDEGVAFATRIWAAGGQAELHIWAGGCHGFDALFPGARISVAARRTRNDWLARVLRTSAGAGR